MEIYTEKTMERLNSGEKKIIFRIILCFVIIGLTKWKSQYCADSSGTILNLRALQSHSRRKVIDPSLQDNLFIPDGFFEYIYQIGCAINLHSITNSGLIPRGQYLHKAWKRHQDAICWVDINPALRKGLKFYQTRWNAIILHETLPAYCIPKIVRMETGRVKYEKILASPRPFLQRFPWNMTGWKNWVQKLFDNQREKLFNNPKVPNQANQIQTQIKIER